jgi:hypothetical protein
MADYIPGKDAAFDTRFSFMSPADGLLFSTLKRRFVMKGNKHGYVRTAGFAALVLAVCSYLAVCSLVSCAQSVGGGGADNRLAALRADAGTLEPAFDPEITAYSLAVPYDTERIRLEAQARSGGARLVPGTVLEQLLNFGENPALTFTVYPEDFSEPRQYTVTVSRDTLVSGAASLDSVLVRDQNGRLWPVSDYGAGDFSAANTGPYTLSVPSTMTRLALVCTAVDSKAAIQIGDQTQTGLHDQSYIENLEYDAPRDIRVIVTAQNGNTKEYIFKVIRLQPVLANSNKLRRIWVNGTLIGGFKSDTTQYTVYVPFSSDSITIAAEAMEIGAAIFHDDEELAEGSVTLPFVSPVSSLDYTLKVVPAGGEAKEYALALKRLAENASGDSGEGSGPGTGDPDPGTGSPDPVEANSAALAGLTVSSGVLSPGFDKTIPSYTVKVLDTTVSVNVTATLPDSTGTIRINGAAATSGTAHTVTLPEDSTVITIETTMPNREIMTYKVRVIKSVKTAPVSDSGFTLSLPDDVGIQGFPQASIKIYQRGSVPGELYFADLPRTFTVTVPGDAGLTVYQWYVDGIPKGTANSIIIDAKNYAEKDHFLSVVILKGGKYYSRGMTFTVALQ